MLILDEMLHGDPRRAIVALDRLLNVHEVARAQTELQAEQLRGQHYGH